HATSDLPPSPLAPFPTRRSSDLAYSFNNAAGADLVARTTRAPGMKRAAASLIVMASGPPSSHVPFTADSREAAVNGTWELGGPEDRKSTRLNSSHRTISYAVFRL